MFEFLLIEMFSCLIKLYFCGIFFHIYDNNGDNLQPCLTLLFISFCSNSTPSMSEFLLSDMFSRLTNLYFCGSLFICMTIMVIAYNLVSNFCSFPSARRFLTVCLLSRSFIMVGCFSCSHSYPAIILTFLWHTIYTEDNITQVKLGYIIHQRWIKFQHTEPIQRLQLTTGLATNWYEF
jgi:hypothetical protein